MAGVYASDGACPETATAFEIRHSGPGRGRGLFATRASKVGTVLLTDAPLAALQLPNNDDDPAGRTSARACARCMRHVGSLSQQLAFAASGSVVNERPVLPRAEAIEVLSDVVPCPGQNCSSVYCSKACMSKDVGHQYMCSELGARVRRYAMKTNRVFELTAKLITAALGSHMADGSSTIETCLEPLRDCISAPWWTIVPMQPEIPREEEPDFREAMLVVAVGAHKRFTEMLRVSAASPKAPEGLSAAVEVCCDETLYHMVAGACNLNCIDITTEDCPVMGYLVALQGLDEVDKAAAATEIRELLLGILQADQTIGAPASPPTRVLAEMVPAMQKFNGGSDDDVDDADGEDEDDSESSSDDGAAAVEPDIVTAEDAWNLASSDKVLDAVVSKGIGVRATALCPMVRFANHSCLPNAEVFFERGMVVKLVASKDIAEGEEILISYVDETLDQAGREAGLQGYGFNCSCDACIVGNRAKRRRVDP